MNKFQSAAKGNLASKKGLVIACDVTGTLFGGQYEDDQNIISGFRKTLVGLHHLQSQGHKVRILSSFPSHVLTNMHDNITQPQLMRCDFFAKLPSEEQEGILAENFWAVGAKGNWQKECDSQHIDIILDDDRPDWCSSYEIHINAMSEEFGKFMISILKNPAQDIMTLARTIRGLPSAPTNENH
jgi:hypothetical protein